MNEELLELLNGTLGLFLLLVTLIIIKDLKREFIEKTNTRISLIFFVLGILVFTIGELYKYGPFDIIIDPIIAELYETAYLFLTLLAFFSFMLRKR